MKCNLKIYANSYINPYRNFIIEDIAEYLSRNASLVYSKTTFQVQRHALELEIKIDKEQEEGDFPSSANWDYCSLQNYEENSPQKLVYYFITNVKAVAQNSIRLSLVMDTLNTFKIGTDYELDKRTRVLREHKDRWIYDEDSEEVYRKIDFYSEGINTPLYKKYDYGNLITNPNVKWYLIYIANNGVIDCYLAPDNPLEVALIESKFIIPSDLEAGKYYQFKGGFEEQTFKTAEGLFLNTNADNNARHYQCIIINLNGANIHYKSVVWAYNLNTHNYFIGQVQAEGDTATLEIIKKGLAVVFNSEPDSPAPNTPTEDFFADASPDLETLNSFDSFDRTQSTIQKIIALPYFPFSVNLDNDGRIIVDGDFEFDGVSKFLKVKSLNVRFNSHIESNIVNPLTTLGVNTPFNDNTYYITAPRHKLFESKLFHSDFFQMKFVYDSFSYSFLCERYDWLEFQNMPTNFEFDFVMTSTINSKFLFKFNEPMYIFSEDYPQVLTIARNNEVVIYNSDYLTYLRTAYNYDVKAKERLTATTILGAGLNVVGNVAGAGLGLASGNPAVAVRGLISAGSGIASSIVGSINAIAQAEDNFNKNIALLKAQSVNVSGSDDLDLLESYSDNKAKLCVYEVSDRIKETLWNLFFYTGYKTDELKSPQLHTRYYFNFIQADIEYKLNKTTIIPIYARDDIKNKFAEGITIIHNNSYSWDINQNFENWETWLITHLKPLP